jgi:hypothetical protein
MKDEREAFEAWALTSGQAYRDECGHGVCFYAADHREPAWQGWTARAALSAAQPAQPVIACPGRHGVPDSR